MIIEFIGLDVEAAEKSLVALTTSWGYHPEPAPPLTPTEEPATGPSTKGIDPLAMASLIVSIPSAILAVADIADRVHKRHRASELIKLAQRLEAQQATARIVRKDHSTELATLTPDQLLDLIADERSAT